MNKLATSLVAFTALTAAASAADLPRRAPPPVFTPVPVFTWTGAYFGVNAGYVTSDSDRVSTVGVFPANITAINNGTRPGAVSVHRDGFTGGGQIGYNYQFTPGRGVVVGVEADAAYTDLNRARGFTGTTGLLNSFRQSQDYLGTVRGRLGYAFDRTLVYATGGFAYGDTTDRVVLFNAASQPSFFGQRNRTNTGWTAGGGIEYALPTDSFLNFFKSSAVTVKAEGLYYNLDRSNVSVTSLVNPTGSAYVSRFQNEGVLGRVGLNYKFGSY